MENIKSSTVSIYNDFSEIEMRLFQLEPNYSAMQQNTINGIKAKHIEVKAELIESLEAVEEAFAESERSGNKAWYIAKYKIINDYAYSIVIDFKKDLENARLSLQVAA